jgi:Glycosyl transferase WecG/TagA/CpsF family
MVAAINQARPDILWVGLTAPKQEKWVHQNLRRLDVRFVAAIGAVFDFYTGRVKRSQGSGEKGVSRAEKNQVTQTIFRVRMLMARLS